MKNIPIFILNKDRFIALKLQVEALHKRNYTNITIIDNKSTYEPLLEWYKSSGVDVYFNPTPKTCNGSLHWLTREFKVERFCKAVTEGHFILNDSDVVPIEECPNDFIERMLELQVELSAHKIGLGLKIDDIPDVFYNKQRVVDIETPYWKNPVATVFDSVTLHQAPIDTTFAVYRPGSYCAWGSGVITRQPEGISGPCYRLGYPYVAKHLPWYYDYNNLPDDEKYYLMNLESGKGPAWSWEAKNLITDQNLKNVTYTGN
jgi:hypothetical protein